jgi:ribosome recycling factor
MTAEQVVQETSTRMDHVVDGVKKDLSGVRTGRASLSMVDHVMVNAYGSDMPLNQVATLALPEPALITVKPFDQTLLGAIEKGIQKADIGITPSNDGKIIRLPVPSLTEERRKQLSKKVNEITEHGKTSIRNIRRESNEKLKKHEKDGDVGADDARKLLDRVQELTDRHVKTLEKLAETKTAEIMTI